jgi:hypothetical protein
MIYGEEYESPDEPDYCEKSGLRDCSCFCPYYNDDDEKCTYPSYEYMEITLKQLFQYSIMHKGILHGILHALKEIFIELYHQIHFKLWNFWNFKLRRNRLEKRIKDLKADIR